MNNNFNLFNCPLEYYNNCSNRIKRCNNCLAGKGSTKLYYDPISLDYSELSLRNHPSYIPKQKKLIDKAKSKQIKQSYQHESVIQEKLIKKTLRSGAVFGDGDLKALDDFLQIDVKKRFNTTSLGITEAEFNKGKNQGTNVWTVTNKNDKTVVIMTEEVFSVLLASNYLN